MSDLAYGADVVHYFVTDADWDQMADFVLPAGTIERALRLMFIRQTLRDEMRMHYGTTS